jgi:hypothetical protein
MKLIISICLLCVVFGAASQDTVHTQKWHYFGLHQFGALSGSSGDRLQVLTTNGINKGNWYTGISTGIDWYGVRSIPVLASLNKAFGHSRNQPFVYGNAGINLPWAQESNNFYYSYRYKGGFMAEAGLGYFITLKNKTAFTFSAGYSYKGVKAGDKYMAIYNFPPYNDPEYSGSSYKFNYRRIAIRLGIKI